MQPVIVTYQDRHSELQYAPIPAAPSELLTKTFQTKLQSVFVFPRLRPSVVNLPFLSGYKNVLYLYSKETGCQYSWNKNGDVRMFDTVNEIMYEWFPKPTYHDACKKQSMTGTTFIFKKDGTVIKRSHPYPKSSPDTVWEHIWPANPESILIEGEESEYFRNWDYTPLYYGDRYWDPNPKSVQEPIYYDDDDDDYYDDDYDKEWYTY